MVAPELDVSEHCCVASEAWLSQGDIFAHAPVLDYPALSQDLVASSRRGPALLMTHGCALDKQTNAGRPTIERLTFLRLRSVDALPDDRAKMLRSTATELMPYETLYLGMLPKIGESYVLVSDPYFVPGDYFGPDIQNFDDSHDAGRRLAITQNDSRSHRLSDEAVELLHAKWIAFWTRKVAQ